MTAETKLYLSYFFCLITPGFLGTFNFFYLITPGFLTYDTYYIQVIVVPKSPGNPGDTVEGFITWIGFHDGDESIHD